LSLDIILEDSGLENVREDTYTVPLGWGGEVGELAMKDVQLTLRQLRPHLALAAGTTEAEVDALIAEYQAECTARGAYLVLFTAYGLAQ
ncbi:hypothetical protein HK405_012247, partial [Cladochytrium tenue]